MTTKMIWTTCSPEKATFLCRELLERKCVGCVNIFEPHTSLYWWNGEICEDREVTIIMETDDKTLTKALKELERLHPYETPKIMVFSPQHVPEEFSTWLRNEVVAKLEK